MSNNMEEKSKVLKMIEEGKVTSDEGLQLLDALENKKTGCRKPVISPLIQVVLLCWLFCV